MKQKDDRFQHQPFYTKLWRLRWYLLIPFKAIVMWQRSRRSDSRPERFKICWDIAIGLAQVDMKWYYSFDELKEFKPKGK